MLIIMYWFDIIVDVCVALGGLGTVGTLVYMILNARNQAKQVKRVQEVQSLQLDVLYTPDARIVAWIDRLSNASLHPSIRIENNGENLIINDIKDLSETALNKEGMQGWFPLNFDKSREITIPLKNVVSNLNSGELFYMVVTNKLDQQYHIVVSKTNNRIEITKITKI